MKTDNLLYALVDDFLAGKLNEEELASFHNLRASDKDLDAKVVSYIHFVQQIKGYGQQISLRKQMDAIHAQMDIADLIKSSKSRRLLFADFVQKYKAVAASAAVIFLFLSLSLLIYTQYTKKSGSYEIMMRREVANIKRSQNNLASKINNIEKGKSKRSGAEKYSGTGFVISSSGYLLTNYHVINGADSLYIQNDKGDVYKVKTVFANPDYDLAILKIEDKDFKGFAALPYSFKKGYSALGERVYTLGYPKDEPVYGEGYLSARSGFNNDTTAYQISLSVNPGNSGGPLFNENGDVIGIISGKQAQMDGFTFAVKSKYLFNTIHDLDVDTLSDKLILSKKNSLAKMNRPEQIQKIKDFVYMVKVYN